ncbi:MAG: AIR carboxylase family protein [Desulfobacterota bacterium]|nr:AIR carboxylase family protein [Thermodesulfobacteriota bacterium]
MSSVVILMGSKADKDHCMKIKNVLDRFNVRCILRIASAHKTPLRVLDILTSYRDAPVVFITVAGRSNALSGFVDANTHHPVIACPPYGDKFSGADLFSSLRMPSGVCPLTVLEPEQAALAAVKMLALHDEQLSVLIKKYQEEKRKEIEADDQDLMATQPAI